MIDGEAPFPLDGGRVGDGGDLSAPRRHKTLRDISAPEWAPKKRSAAYSTAKGRRLRQGMTFDEDQLWQALRKLKRNVRWQAPMGAYVVDFVSHAAKLVIEVDGYYHSLPERQIADAERDAWFVRQGYRVMRIAVEDVQRNLPGTVDRILAQLSPPSPALPPSRGKGDSENPLPSAISSAE